MLPCAAGGAGWRRREEVLVADWGMGKLCRSAPGYFLEELRRKRMPSGSVGEGVNRGTGEGKNTKEQPPL